MPITCSSSLTSTRWPMAPPPILAAAASAAAPSMSAQSTLAALGGESLRDRQTDARPGSGHDRGLTGQVWMVIDSLHVRISMRPADPPRMTVFADRPEHDKAEPWHVVGKPERRTPRDHAGSTPRSPTRQSPAASSPGEQAAGPRPVRMDAGRQPRRCPAPTSVVSAPLSSPPHRHARRAEHIPGQALDVDVQRHGYAGTGRADDHRQMLAAVVRVAETDDPRVAGPGGQDRLGQPDDLRLGAPPIRDELVDRDHGQPVFDGEFDQFGATGHRAGIVGATRSRTAPPPRRRPARRARSTAASAGPGRPKHPVRRMRLYRDHVTRPLEIRSSDSGRRERRDGPGAVGRRDSGAGAANSRPTRSGRWRIGRRDGTSAAGSAAHIRPRAARRGHSPRCAGW